MSSIADLKNAYRKKIYCLDPPNGLTLLGECEGVSMECSIDCIPDVTLKLNPCVTDRFVYNPSYDMQSIYPPTFMKAPWLDAADSIATALELYRGKRGNYKMNEIKNVTIKRFCNYRTDLPVRLTVEWDSYVNKKTEVCTYGYSFIPDVQSALARCFIMYRIGMKKLIFNDDVTVAIWDDKTKTIVRRNEKEEYDQDTAFYMCVAKHMIGEKKSLPNLLKKWTGED